MGRPTFIMGRKERNLAEGWATRPRARRPRDSRQDAGATRFPHRNHHAVTVLVEVNLLESQTLQQTADRRSRILLGRSQNAIRQGGLLHLAFRPLPHLRFQIRVGRYQQPGLPRIHPRLSAIKPRAEHLRRG